MTGDTSINLKLLKENDALAQFFAIICQGKIWRPWIPNDLFNAMYAHYVKVMEENQEIIQPVYYAEDILRNQKSGMLSSFLTIEDGVSPGWKTGEGTGGV